MTNAFVFVSTFPLLVRDLDKFFVVVVVVIETGSLCITLTGPDLLLDQDGLELSRDSLCSVSQLVGGVCHKPCTTNS